MGSCFKEENILTSVESKGKDSLRSKAFPCGFGGKNHRETRFSVLAMRKVRNHIETLSTQASGTEFRYNIHCVGSLCDWIPSVHSLCAKSVVLGFIITFTWLETCAIGFHQYIWCVSGV